MAGDKQVYGANAVFVEMARGLLVWYSKVVRRAMHP